VDFRGGWDSDHAFQPLVNAIKGVPLGPPQARSDADGAAPYRGLQTFDEEQRGLALEARVKGFVEG
jgi:hypothetical protein